MHLETLKVEARELLPYIHNFKSFYLAGGTAVALQIGHRISVDFDFFSSEPIAKTCLAYVKSKLPADVSINVAVNDSSQLTLFVNEVKLSFLHYPFPVILPFVADLNMLSLPELAATKAYTIGGRGEYKDYVDMYFLLEGGHISLNDLLKLTKDKYQNDFNDRLFLEQLIYLDDLDTTNVRLLKQSELSKDKVKDFFVRQLATL